MSNLHRQCTVIFPPQQGHSSLTCPYIADDDDLLSETGVDDLHWSVSADEHDLSEPTVTVVGAFQPSVPMHIYHEYPINAA
jgi:hypothetical protein